MQTQFKTNSPSTGFDKKREETNIVKRASSVSTSVSLASLEATRVTSLAPPASKNGLETICGASCATGAM